MENISRDTPRKGRLVSWTSLGTKPFLLKISKILSQKFSRKILSKTNCVKNKVLSKCVY